MRKVEELGVSILGSLFKFCTGERLDRLVLKFGENECEKIDRLCELYCRYSDKLQALDSRYAAADAARAQHPRWLAANEEERASLLEEVAEERYLERLDAGLYTMQLLAALLASIWVRLLGQHSSSPSCSRSTSPSAHTLRVTLCCYRARVSNLEGCHTTLTPRCFSCDDGMMMSCAGA